MFLMLELGNFFRGDFFCFFGLGLGSGMLTAKYTTNVQDFIIKAVCISSVGISSVCISSVYSPL